MKDVKAMAYVNMFGVLGALENLCAMDGRAKEILSRLKRPVSLGLEVSGGPSATFHFTHEGCRMEAGCEHCGCKMRFASPEKFNAMIESGKPGVPVRRPVQLLLFLAGPFTALTNRLTELLRPSEDALKDRAFFEENTILTMYTIAGAISALANHDPIARISAGYTVDGDVSLGIPGCATATIRVRDHQFETVKAPSERPRAVMEFADLDLAHNLFAGKASTVNEMCRGTIRLSGMISMIDNINRILDRVSVYLA